MKTIVTLIIAMAICGNAYADTIKGVNVERLANAIYKAEGGSKTKHPYGVLQHYKHTTSRQACINTIKHRLKDWNGKGDFIAVLQKVYCPIGCSNDNGNNKYWYTNVSHYYNKGI